MSRAAAIVLASEQLVIAARDGNWSGIPSLLLARRVLLNALEREKPAAGDGSTLQAMRAAVLESDRVFATLDRAAV